MYAPVGEGHGNQQPSLVNSWWLHPPGTNRVHLFTLFPAFFFFQNCENFPRDRSSPRLLDRRVDERILGARILSGQMYSFDREMLGWYENIIYGVKINVLVLYDELCSRLARSNNNICECSVLDGHFNNILSFHSSFIS